MLKETRRITNTPHPPKIELASDLIGAPGTCSGLNKHQTLADASVGMLRDRHELYADPVKNVLSHGAVWTARRGHAADPRSIQSIFLFGGYKLPTRRNYPHTRIGIR